MFRRGLINGAIITASLLLAVALTPRDTPWRNYLVVAVLVAGWGLSARMYNSQFGALMSLLDTTAFTRIFKFSLGAAVTWGPVICLVSWSHLGLDQLHPVLIALTFLAFIPIGAMNVFLFMASGAMFFGRKGALWG